MTKRILCSLGAALLVPAILWVGGVDFDQRGPLQAWVAWIALMVGICCYIYPGWGNDGDGGVA